MEVTTSVSLPVVPSVPITVMLLVPLPPFSETGLSITYGVPALVCWNARTVKLSLPAPPNNVSGAWLLKTVKLSEPSPP